jgi:vacuolar-type H+-ATPase subunit I/STV1
VTRVYPGAIAVPRNYGRDELKPNDRGGMMALSDQLMRLASRAKEAEDRAAAAQNKAKTDLQQEVDDAREVSQAQARSLSEAAETGGTKVSDWWNDVQRTWNEHLATVRENIDDKKAEMDRDRAESRAEDAEADAGFAIDYAYSAVEEAEYAVLDATLARKEADEIAASGASA